MQRAGQSQSPVGWEGGGEEHKYSAVMYETEDGKTTSKSSRLIKVTNLVMIMSTRSMCVKGRRRELEQREHPLPSDGHDQKGHSCAQVILTKFIVGDKAQSLLFL